MCEYLVWSHQVAVLNYVSFSNLVKFRIVCRRWKKYIDNILNVRRNRFLKILRTPELLCHECISLDNFKTVMVHEHQICVINDIIYRFGGRYQNRYSNIFDCLSLKNPEKWINVEVCGTVRPPPTSNGQIKAFGEDGEDPFIVLTCSKVFRESRFSPEINHSLHATVYMFKIREKCWIKFELPLLKDASKYSAIFIGKRIVFHGHMYSPEIPTSYIICVFDIETNSCTSYRTNGLPSQEAPFYVAQNDRIFTFPAYTGTDRDPNDLFVDILTFDWSNHFVSLETVSISISLYSILPRICFEQLGGACLSLYPDNESTRIVRYPIYRREEGNSFVRPVMGIGMDVTFFNPSFCTKIDSSCVQNKKMFFKTELFCKSVAFVPYFDCLYAVCCVSDENCLKRAVYYIY